MTTTDTLVDKLVESASKGRGLWIGLDVDRSPKHELLRLELEEQNKSYGFKLTEETHVTLAHLGRQNGRREVEAAVTACSVVSNMLHVASVGVEGLGRLRNHLVAILAPRWIDEAAAQIDRCLVDHHVYPDRSFAGIRHASIGTVRHGNPVLVPLVDLYVLRVSTMMVVCGGEKITFSLLPEKTGVF